MTGLRYTLLGDGRSDRMLRFPIRWALRARGVVVDGEEWADLRALPNPPVDLADRVRWALRLHPADLLFVHRDAEGQGRDYRLREVERAVAGTGPAHVAVVPVRMTEAWFLHDEAAIRRASGNPAGRVDLSLPSPRRVERLIDPKGDLDDLLLTASELAGRRRERRRRDLATMRFRVAELITDFSPLRAAPAFGAFLVDLDRVLALLHASRRNGTTC